MSDQPSGAGALWARARFNLSEFVLGYLEEAGSVVMPPEFGVYEVLMPEEVADSLSLDDHTRLAFTGSPPHPEGTQLPRPEGSRAALRLSVNHPLVESIAQTITRQPASARTSIRGVRTDKRGLAELARQHFSLANARIDALPQTQEEAVQHHYLLCNFKITLLSEEKREELAVVVMDVQAGHAVDDPAILQRLETIDPAPAYAGLPVAPPRWQERERAPLREPPGLGREALAPDTLQALLPRAEAALRHKLADQVAALAARMERQLMLDLARIGDYYDEMATDLQRRQAHLPPDDAERRQGFADKLVMLEAERTAKLADARNRYALRIEMKLVNVLLANQAKVILPMSISNRSATITRTVVWDPLVHRLEPLVCDVCGKPCPSPKRGEGSQRLYLCTGGHLAHAACLAPQCIDCKRAFCQLCAEQIAECVVCHRPVCRPSLVQCSSCGRGTCSEHQQLCHAGADGTPLDVATLPEPAAPLGEAVASTSTKEVVPLPPAQQRGDPKPPAQSRSKSGAANSARNAVTKRSKTKSSSKVKPKPMAKGVRIDVQIYEEEPTVVAFVMRSTKRVLATRSFTLTPQGILVQCQCEKDPCPANGYYHRPSSPAAITEQIAAQLRTLQKEYYIPSKKVKYYSQRFGQIQAEKRFVLPVTWRDPARLTEARRGFDRLGRE